VKISENGLALIQHYEGCRLSAYTDSAGIPTIGYGHTKGVQMGDVCSDTQALEWLAQDVTSAEECVTLCTASVRLTQNEFDALVSFTFNLGCAALRNSTLLRKLNAGDRNGAAVEFGRWNHAGGKVVDGLTMRRHAEADLFQSVA
jgi:lysozyme